MKKIKWYFEFAKNLFEAYEKTTISFNGWSPFGLSEKRQKADVKGK